MLKIFTTKRLVSLVLIISMLLSITIPYSIPAQTLGNEIRICYFNSGAGTYTILTFQAISKSKGIASLTFDSFPQKLIVNKNINSPRVCEYYWGVQFSDGSTIYEVNTTRFKTTLPEKEEFVLNFPHSLTLIDSNGLPKEMFSDYVKVSINNTTITWQFEIPNDSINLFNIKYLELKQPPQDEKITDYNIRPWTQIVSFEIVDDGYVQLPSGGLSDYVKSEVELDNWDINFDKLTKMITFQGGELKSEFEYQLHISDLDKKEIRVAKINNISNKIDTMNLEIPSLGICVPLNYDTQYSVELKVYSKSNKSELISIKKFDNIFIDYSEEVILLIKDKIKSTYKKLGNELKNYDFSSPIKDERYYQLLSILFSEKFYGIKYINEYAEDQYILNVLEKIDADEIGLYDAELGNVKRLLNQHFDEYQTYSPIHYVSLESQENSKNNLLGIQYLLLQNTVIKNTVQMYGIDEVIQPLISSIDTGTPIELYSAYDLTGLKSNSIYNKIRNQDISTQDFFNKAETQEFKEALSLIVDFSKYGAKKLFIEAITGKDPISGNEVKFTREEQLFIFISYYSEMKMKTLLNEQEIKKYSKLNLDSSNVKKFNSNLKNTTNDISKTFAECAGISKWACFTGDTLVAIENGNKRIDEIKVGDHVWAENTETREKQLKQVTNVFENHSSTLIHITVNGEQINTTPEHPFYVENQGWTLAKDLKQGDSLRLLYDQIAIIEDIVVEPLKQLLKVYNFAVEDFHSYFVSTQSILVHNASKSGACYVKQLVKDVPQKYKSVKECEKFANSLEELMKKNSIQGERLLVESNAGIFSDKLNLIISENGKHHAIRINDIIFDNINPNGIPYESWSRDLGISLIPSEFKVIPTPIN